MLWYPHEIQNIHPIFGLKQVLAHTQPHTHTYSRHIIASPNHRPTDTTMNSNITIFRAQNVKTNYEFSLFFCGERGTTATCSSGASWKYLYFIVSARAIGTEQWCAFRISMHTQGQKHIKNDHLYLMLFMRAMTVNANGRRDMFVSGNFRIGIKFLYSKECVKHVPIPFQYEEEANSLQNRAYERKQCFNCSEFHSTKCQNGQNNRTEWAREEQSFWRKKEEDQVLTGNNGAPLTQTLSAKRTRLGRVRSLARFPADKSVDFRPGQLMIDGWHTNKLTWVSHDRTNWITWSRGASFTSSPFTAKIRSPGSNYKWFKNEFIQLDSKRCNVNTFDHLPFQHLDHLR